jgi:hypothetical protein
MSGNTKRQCERTLGAPAARRALAAPHEAIAADGVVVDVLLNLARRDALRPLLHLLLLLLNLQQRLLVPLQLLVLHSLQLLLLLELLEVLPLLPFEHHLIVCDLPPSHAR